MDKMRYISVILPLKLEWEPCYAVKAEIYSSMDPEVGDRVRVTFAHHQYIGVVSATDVLPEIDPAKIQEVLTVEKELESILPEEIALWRSVAEYYMCTVGEVYKAAYPAMKVSLEEARAAARQKVMQRRERLIESMRAKVSKIRCRLARKDEMLSKDKEGTKARLKHLEERKRIEKELTTAVEALAKAERHVEDTLETHVVHHESAGRLELNHAQSRAYDGIIKGFQAGKPVLLNGVTGSGKTEIYIKLAKENLERGRNVLYLAI